MGIFQVSNNDHLIRTLRRLKDVEGNVVGQLRNKKTPGIHTAYYIGTAENDKAVALKKSGLRDPTKCEADILVDGKGVGWVRGDGTVSNKIRAFEVGIDGKHVATIAPESILDPQVFKGEPIHGAPLNEERLLIRGVGRHGIRVLTAGVDLALVALIAMGIDELYFVRMFET